MMNNKDQFTSTLVMLADLTGKSMSAQLFDIYFNALDPLGLDKVNKVLLQFIEEFKFPSIVEIRSRLGFTIKEPDDEQKSRLLTQKVVSAIGKFGWSNEKEAEKFFGDDWKIVTGYATWSVICDVDNDGLSTFQAQFREYSKAYLSNIKYNAHLSLTSKIKDLIDINSLSRDLT
jgi:hypothetical protein